MKIESRELNIVNLIIKPCERLTTKQLLDFNNFIIIINDNILNNIVILKIN